MKYSLAAAVTLIFFLTTAPVTGTDYYRSNSIGMVFEKIPEIMKNDYDWIIEISSADKVETRVIYNKGDAIKKIEYYRSENSCIIKEYSDLTLIKVEEERDGLTIDEKFYNDDGSVDSYTFLWKDRRLEKSVYTKNGKIVYEDIFIVSDRGRIKQIRRFYESGKFSASGFSYSRGEISSEWHASENSAVLYLYENSTNVQFEKWENDNLVATKIYIPLETGNKIIESDLAAGRVVEQIFDIDGRQLSEESRSRSGISKTIFMYQNNLLVQKLISSPGIREKYLYSYDNEGNIITESLDRGGFPAKEIYYSAGKKELEKVYRDNSLVMIIHYKDGEIIKEEQVQ